MTVSDASVMKTVPGMWPQDHGFGLKIKTCGLRLLAFGFGPKISGLALTNLVLVSHSWLQQSVADLGVVHPTLVLNSKFHQYKLIHTAIMYYRYSKIIGEITNDTRILFTPYC